MLAVIDYGGGNLGSLVAALERRRADFIVTADAEVVALAEGAILPGDGAFGATMEALRARKLDRAIVQTIDHGRPFLGICVGMQILFESSTEFGGAPGLAVFPGEVARFKHGPRIPHMGWNNLELLCNSSELHDSIKTEAQASHPFVTGLGENDYAYFLHSYRVPVGSATVAAATHGERFSAVVARDNVMGTQFHPEKSQKTGARLLDNFLTIVETARKARDAEECASKDCDAKNSDVKDREAT